MSGLEIQELKTAALEHIKRSLTPHNIMAEVCSAFTTRFPEIQEIEREYLKSQWVWNVLKIYAVLFLTEDFRMTLRTLLHSTNLLRKCLKISLSVQEIYGSRFLKVVLRFLTRHLRNQNSVRSLIPVMLLVF